MMRRRAGSWSEVALIGGLLLFAVLPSVIRPGMAATLSLASKPLTIYRNCTLTATPNTSTAETDSYVDQAAPNTNNGAAATMDSQSSNNANRRSYLRFDLTKCRPAIPASANITNALVRLLLSAVPAACRTEDIFRATAAWTEAGITWNNQPFGTGVNNPPTAQRTDFITVGAAPCQNTTNFVYVNGWNVVPDVQAFVSGTATNYGWMIRDDAENSATARTVTYAQKDANFLVASPQLIITYR